MTTEELKAIASCDPQSTRGHITRSIRACDVTAGVGILIAGVVAVVDAVETHTYSLDEARWEEVTLTVSFHGEITFDADQYIEVIG